MSSNIMKIDGKHTTPGGQSTFFRVARTDSFVHYISNEGETWRLVPGGRDFGWTKAELLHVSRPVAQERMSKQSFFPQNTEH